MLIAQAVGGVEAAAPLGSAAAAAAEAAASSAAVAAAAATAPWQGLTLVHFSAQHKHMLWDTVGA